MENKENKSIEWAKKNVKKEVLDRILISYKRYKAFSLTSLFLLVAVIVISGCFYISTGIMRHFSENVYIGHIREDKVWYVDKIRNEVPRDEYHLEESRNGDIVYVYLDDNGKVSKIITKLEYEQNKHDDLVNLVVPVISTLIVLLILFIVFKNMFFSDYLHFKSWFKKDRKNKNMLYAYYNYEKGDLK